MMTGTRPQSIESREIEIGPLTDRTGIAIVDKLERCRYELHTPKRVRLSPARSDALTPPIDVATTISTRSIALPTIVPVRVEGPSGQEFLDTGRAFNREFPRGEYTIELSAPVKIYLCVTAAVSISCESSQLRLEFGRERDVTIGGRSLHRTPAGTITTTADPTDAMAAVSLFGSALKTTSPERSFPTLRGHPPVLELGDRFDAPADLNRPETGIRIELPPEYDLIYAVAPLAYYLGAEVTTGDVPKIATDSGYEHHFPTERSSFITDVARVLKQTFFMDCLARTGGLYPVNLYERHVTDPILDIDVDAAYEQPLSDRLETYLDVPFSRIADHLPEWHVVAHVEPTLENARILPFLVDQLAVVQTVADRGHTGHPSESDPKHDVQSVHRYSDAHSNPAVNSRPPIHVEEGEELLRIWAGTRKPIGANETTVAGHHHRLDRTPTAGDLEIVVVCNDPQMEDESDLVARAYSSRQDLPFDVDIVHGASTDELAAIVRDDADLHHYIGHVSDDGLSCPDGRIDIASIESVGMDAFFLNGCESYDQGRLIVERGAIAGLATLTPVHNFGAIRMGRTVARLLNCGFSFGAALQIAKESVIAGRQYIVIGDVGLTVTQAAGGTPYVCEIERAESGFALRLNAYPTSERGIGSLVKPYLDDNDWYFLNVGRLKTFELSETELVRFLELEDVPVIMGGSLYWSSELDRETLRSEASSV